MKKVIEISANKRYVTKGPHLWVSQLLHLRGSISANKIWEEYLKDNTLEDRDMIRSKSFLKNSILHNMRAQGKIEKATAHDMIKSN